MSHSSAVNQYRSAPRSKPVGEFPQVRPKLKLVCGPCGCAGNYAVGRVLVDPELWADYRDGSVPFEDLLSFSGLFRCKHCGADGPWQIPPTTETMLIAALAMPTEPGEFGVQFGVLQLSDGTRSRSGATSEAHLKQKIAEEPDNAFLWGRLGNFYQHAGVLDQARAAFEKSLELDPDEIESLHSLANYRMAEGDLTGAGAYYERVVELAPSATGGDHDLLVNMVRHSLEQLFDLHLETDGEVPFPPKLNLPSGLEENERKPNEIVDLQLDLNTDEGWEVLTSICLTGKVPERIRRREEKQLAETERFRSRGQDVELIENGHALDDPVELRPLKKAGRNDPCPCGSGKKYKRCCWSK